MVNLLWFVFILTPGLQLRETSSLNNLSEAGDIVNSGELSDISAPEITLQIEGVGNGFSTPAITEKLIYITGEIDSLGYLMAFDWDGNEIWRNCYGPEWIKSFRGSRAAPVVDQMRVYVCSGYGSIICYHAITGEQLWHIDMVRDLGGQNVTYGYSIPVLIDGDQLFCSPGGTGNNVVALDKNSGNLLWSSPGAGETAGYGKPLIIQRGGLKILMTFSEFTFMGLNARTGEVLWTYDLNFKGELPCNQPIYEDGIIYIVAGPGNGAVTFQLSADGKSIREKWKNIDFNSAFGGFVLVDDYLVGSADFKRSYVSMNKRTGKIKSQLRFGIGASTYANDVLIAYNQRGQLGLMSLEEGKLRLLKQFMISEGTGEHFALPVMFQDILLIRHGNALVGYRIISS